MSDLVKLGGLFQCYFRALEKSNEIPEEDKPFFLKSVHSILGKLENLRTFR